MLFRSTETNLHSKPPTNVKVIITSLLIVIPAEILIAQQIRFFLQGKVLDAKTKLPLSSATIKVKSQGAESSSNSNGLFELHVKGSDRDSLEISHIGYKTIKKKITELGNQEVFFLEDYSVQLKTLTI